MLLIKKTHKSVDEAGQALEAAAARQSFGVLAVHDLQATMAKKGVDDLKAVAGDVEEKITAMIEEAAL